MDNDLNRLNGLRLTREQFIGLFIKHFIYTKRNPIRLICQLSPQLSVILLVTSILTSNAFLPNLSEGPSSGNILSIRHNTSSASLVVPILFACIMPIGLAFLAAGFATFPMEQRLTKVKHLQAMTCSPIIYWSTAFIWDMIIVVIISCVMTACFPIFQRYNLFASNGGLGVFLLILCSYGICVIPFSYIASLLFPRKFLGFTIIWMIHCASGVFGGYIASFLNESFNGRLADLISWIFPTYQVARTITKWINIAFINASSKFNSGLDYELSNGSNVSVSGISWQMLQMALMGLIYMCVLLCLEYGIFQKMDSCRKHKPQLHASVEEEDVRREVHLVSSLVANGNMDEYALVVQNICKRYGPFPAVSNFSVALKKGECFGLLGLPGTGKSTLMKILTGDKLPSSGNAFLSMNSLKGNKRQFCSNIGYCPEADGFIDFFTGEELLELFCRLRGVPKPYRSMEVEKWLKNVGLLENSNLLINRLDFGEKRRLSIALAVIGDPPILLLDDPAKDVDSVSLHYLKNVIRTAKNSGQTILITSQSLGEIESLCSRFGIIMNGQLQCIGDLHHLRNKFCRGFSVSIKLNPVAPAYQEKMDRLWTEISGMFSPHIPNNGNDRNILQFRVNNSIISWTDLIRNLEYLKGNYNYRDIILDYQVNELTVQDVFLSNNVEKLPGFRDEDNDRYVNDPFRWLIVLRCLPLFL